MFVRFKKTPLSEKTAVQLVENQRVNGKVRQKIIRHFGYAFSEKEKEALKKIALSYKLELETKRQPTLFETGVLLDMICQASQKDFDQKIEEKSMLVDLNDIVEEKRIKVGYHQVYGSLFDQIGFSKVLPNWSKKKATVRLMKDVILARIHQPQSKLATVESLGSHFDVKANINSIYRMMDYIDDQTIEKIQSVSYKNTTNLLGHELDVVFYDCTTLYFESFEEDELKENGFSKDGKFNQAQIILALLVTQQGLPVGYQVFSGSTFEGHTLVTALKCLGDKYKIKKVIFVADAAMLNTENLELLHEKKQKFIVGARIKNMPKAIENKIVDKNLYQPLYEDKQGRQVKYQVIDLPQKPNQSKQRLIVTYSPKRATKDKFDRQKAIEKLKLKLEKNKTTKGFIKNSAVKKFLDISQDSQVSLNEQKIEQAEQWDGLHGIITDAKVTPDSVKNILDQYKGLWQVEETFRISKHNMKMRPIYHWTPRRIKSHIALCFIALTLIRTLEYKVRYQYKKMSPEQIRYHISKLESSILKDTKTNKKYVLPSQPTQEAKKIYQLLNLNYRATPYPLK